MSQLSRPADLLGPAADLFRKADLAIANLEYPLTTAESKLTKYGSHQKGDPETLRVLKEAGIGLVTLANNHVLDYGQQGLADTLAACARENIAVVGAGRTEEEAGRPFCVTIKGRRVAVLGICESEFSIARDGRGGACRLDPMANYDAIRKARDDAELVIVLFHGGNEFTHYPSPRMVRTCRFFADVGASAVVCHHPHYVQGCETYHGVPILYSLGKLFYTRMRDPDILEIPIARLGFSGRGLEPSVDVDFFRVSLDQMRLVEPTPDELRASRQRFRTYCEGLASPETIQSEWNTFCAARENDYLAYLLAIPNLVLRIARRLRLDRLVRVCARLKRRELLCLENVIRCEAHRDVVLHLLEKEHAP